MHYALWSIHYALCVRRIMYYSLCIKHYRLHILYNALWIEYYAFCIKHYTLCILSCISYIIDYWLCIMYSALHIIHNALWLCIMHYSFGLQIMNYTSCIKNCALYKASRRTILYNMGKYLLQWSPPYINYIVWFFVNNLEIEIHFLLTNLHKY